MLVTDMNSHNLYPSKFDGETLVTNPYSRRNFLEATLVAGATVAAAPNLFAAGAPHLSRLVRQGGDFDIPDGVPSSSAPPKPQFPVSDYHVHLSNTLSIEQALQLAKDRGVQIGILEHPGEGFPIHTDADLQKYIDNLRKYPVRIGLQPVYPGWSKAFSKPVLDQLDYILMDALTLPNPDGTWLAIWQIDTMVDDAERFMNRYMQFIEQILTTEPIDIFGWPTFLPVPIARQYSQLWTPTRVARIIELAKARKLAIEINEVAHVPDEKFISEAKRAGLKFTFGTDSRNHHAAHFYYCYEMAQKCGLTEGDMFAVKKK
jgi:histidinol phosphatase-like PHP family hydrolase